MRVIVTRPIEEGKQWVHALCNAGYLAESLPLIRVAPTADPTAVVAAWNKLGNFDAVMFVSGNAVDHFFALKPPQAPVFGTFDAINTRAFVIGPGSFSALKRAQVNLRCIDMPDKSAEQFDSEALWSVVSMRVKAPFRVLIVRGTVDASPARDEPKADQGAGRDWFANKVRAAGGTVEFVVSYKRSSPVLSVSERSMVQEAAVDGSVWLFSSSEAIGNLVAACGDQSWVKAKAVVTHSRIALAARQAGFDVVCESRPTLAALLASIESLA